MKQTALHFLHGVAGREAYPLALRDGKREGKQRHAVRCVVSRAGEPGSGCIRSLWSVLVFRARRKEAGDRHACRATA